MIQNEYEKTDTMMMDEYDTRGKKVRGVEGELRMWLSLVVW